MFLLGSVNLIELASVYCMGLSLGGPATVSELLSRSLVDGDCSIVIRTQSDFSLPAGRGLGSQRQGSEQWLPRLKVCSRQTGSTAACQSTMFGVSKLGSFPSPPAGFAVVLYGAASIRPWFFVCPSWDLAVPLEGFDAPGKKKPAASTFLVAPEAAVSGVGSRQDMSCIPSIVLQFSDAELARFSVANEHPRTNSPRGNLLAGWERIYRGCRNYGDGRKARISVG